MTFEEFWEKNYAKDFGDCEPYYGIASHAFEAGQKNCDCVHTDNSAVIERLQNENEQLKKQYEFLSNQIFNKECAEVWGENDKLKEQIPKWHKVADGDLPTYGKWILCKMKDGYDPYIVSLTDAINDDVFLTGYETEETNGFENVIAWCEIPKYEENLK